MQPAQEPPIRIGKPPHPFEYQRPTACGVAAIESIRRACRSLNDLICEVVPAGREQALAITKLEEVSMWANKGIVMRPGEVPLQSTIVETRPRRTGEPMREGGDPMFAMVHVHANGDVSVATDAPAAR